MLALIFSLVWLAMIGYALGKNPNLPEISHSSARQARFFPFYTIGRFVNEVCTGANQMLGTCVIRGECSDGGGVSTGSCNSITSQAVCCVYQLTCGGSTNFNNTYFYNSGYPGTFNGGSKCALTVMPCSDEICQLRIDFLAFSLAPPNGDGECLTDFISITGGSSRVPRICGENAGQHVYVDFNGVNPIEIAVLTTGSYTFNRQWQLQVSQIACNSAYRAPSGCLQYYLDGSGTIMSFNYASSPNGLPNSIGVEGSRQLANQRYGICIRMGANKCSITYSQISSDIYSFTMTGDVGAIDPVLLGTVDVQSQQCTMDFIIIPNPAQGGVQLDSDRFCGLGLVPTTSYMKPFVLYVVHDANENTDISNRGFALDYSQGACPVT
ncbi:unnamed protein product [Hermetia illucens]|uniref:CUB domain-containing protein n=3 Tax=Hermetia illucens TaxID=343691 RepID=A0A7R8UK38_HERIL|nr:unnamed protein product [Hermetia illucens]